MNLKDLRESACLSQMALAHKAGVSQQMISHLETGRRDWQAANVQSLRAIVAALNEAGVPCTLDDVFPPSASSAA